MQGRWRRPEAYHSPIHLNCLSNRPLRHTTGHVAHTHGWHIPAHHPGKTLAGGREGRRRECLRKWTADTPGREQALFTQIDSSLETLLLNYSLSHIQISFGFLKIIVNLLDCLLSIHFPSSSMKRKPDFVQARTSHPKPPEEDLD